MGQRVLVIRFSAIGDVLLTAPVVKALSEAGHTVTFLVKGAYKDAAKVLPAVNNILSWEWDQLSILENAAENYDVVLDLHGTWQSKHFTKSVGLPTFTFKKPYWRRFLLLRTKSKRFALSHVVQRYFEAAAPLLDQPIAPSTVTFKAPKKACVEGKVVFVIGGSSPGKCLSTDQWLKILSFYPGDTSNIALLGGPSDQWVADLLREQFPLDL